MLLASEYLMHEPLPLHRIQEAIFEFCRGRGDIAIFGAQAVNIYVTLPRMSQDVDILATDPRRIAEVLAAELGARFHVAIRVREVKPGIGYRVYQLASGANRHLADVRRADFALDDAKELDDVRYVSLRVLVAMKVCALTKRRAAPKGATDLADLRRLLIAHPELRGADPAMEEALERVGADAAARAVWEELVAAPTVTDDDTDEGY
jgi:hypothetical protein